VYTMYEDRPYAREVGHVGEAAGIAASAGVTEGHDVPPDANSPGSSTQINYLTCTTK